MGMSIEGAVRKLQMDGIDNLHIYWLEDIKDGETGYWVDVCEDRLMQLSNFSWVWDIIDKSEADKEGICENMTDEDIVVDLPYSEAVIKQAVEEWLEDRNLKIDVEVISSEGTLGEIRLLESLSRLKQESTEIL